MRGQSLTQLLDEALAVLQTLSESEQDAIAAIILDELADECQWDEAFAGPGDQLERLAAGLRQQQGAVRCYTLQPARLVAVGRAHHDGLAEEGQARAPGLLERRVSAVDLGIKRFQAFQQGAQQRHTVQFGVGLVIPPSA